MDNETDYTNLHGEIYLITVNQLLSTCIGHLYSNPLYTQAENPPKINSVRETISHLLFA